MWQDKILALRFQALDQDYPSLAHSSDPTLLLANFMAHASVIYLWRELRSNQRPEWNTREYSLLATYQHRALMAVEQTVELARSLTDFHFFKVIACRWPNSPIDF